jgi:putative NIF3 family GTP cyclohydrolase 1 type 2
MNVNPKSTKENVREGPAGKPDVPEVFPVAYAELFHKGFEKLVNLQKSALDVFTAHAVETNQLYRQAFKGTPAAAFFDVTDESLTRLAEAKKSVLDLYVEQSAQVIGTFKEPGSVEKTTAAAKDLFSDTAERYIATQKIVLDFAAQQNQTVGETVKKQPGVTGTPAAGATDAIQKSVDALITTQKQFVEAAAHPLKTATSAKA